MKQIKVNTSNKQYYSDDFINGFECGTKAQFEADKYIINRIKEAKEEIERNAYPIVHGVNNHNIGMTLYGTFKVFDNLMEDIGESNE